MLLSRVPVSGDYDGGGHPAELQHKIGTRFRVAHSRHAGTGPSYVRLQGLGFRAEGGCKAQPISQTSLLGKQRRGAHATATATSGCSHLSLPRPNPKAPEARDPLM